MKAIRLLNLLALLGVITVNALANILPINDKTTGHVSAMYNNYFTPAGFTFSIWGLIYMTLLAFVIYQLWERRSSQAVSLDKALGYNLLINFLSNIAWIFAWHYGYFLVTVVLILIMLVTLVTVNVQTSGFSWIVKFPLQLYLGWICVATIANVAVWLTYLEWDAWGLEGWYWGVLLVTIAGALAVVLAIRRGLIVTALTIAWGLFGIYGKQTSTPNGVEAYAYLCLAVIAVILMATGALMVNSLRRA